MSTLLNRISHRISLLQWKLHTLVGNTGLRTFNLPDSIQIDYPLLSEVGKQLFLGQFELGETDFFKSVLKRGDIVLDIGANAGIYSIIASQIVGKQGHIYAFEIGPSEIKMFRNNIAKNKVQNVTLLEYAVSNQTGQAKFAISRDGAMNSLAKNNHPAQSISEWLTVQTITLKDAALKYKIDHVDIIKMDVEGAEKLVFEGGLDTLLKWRPRYILFEASNLTSQAFGYTVSEFIHYLYQNKFEIFSLDGSKLVPLPPKSQPRPEQYNFVAIPVQS